jgi:hypothetical protein
MNGEKDTVLVGLGGILIAIGGDTFINAEGESVNDRIDLNLVEIKSFSDIVGSGLQTASGDNILQTAGMIFIDALSDGKPLRIKAGKSIVINMSGFGAFTNANVFTGQFSKEGNIDWRKISDMETDLIPFPIDLLDFNYGAWESWYTEDQIKLLQDTKFRNTFIHTRANTRLYTI